MRKPDPKLPRRRLVYPALAERREEERWLTECGLTRERLTPMAAPADLTALVMARISGDPAAAVVSRRAPAGLRREGLPAVAATLLVSLLLLAVSAVGFVAVAPGDALLALGALLTAAVSVVELLRQVLLLLTGAFTSDVVILACAAVPAAALVLWYRTMRDATSLTREA